MQRQHWPNAEGVELVFEDLGLTLNEEKIWIVDARQESFNFLGFSIGMKRGKKTGKMYPHTEPSKKALKHIRSEIKQLTTERHSAIPTEDVIRRVNEVARGRVGYFHYGNRTRALTVLKRYLVYRMRVYLRLKHRYHSFGYKAYSDAFASAWPSGIASTRVTGTFGVYSITASSFPALLRKHDEGITPFLSQGYAVLEMQAVSGRRRRPSRLASVRRSNPACSFSALGFHKGCLSGRCYRRY